MESVLLVLVGKIQIIIHSSPSIIWNKTVRKNLFRTVLIITLAALFAAGCARQKIRTPDTAVYPKVPGIRIALEEKLQKARIHFIDPFRLSSEEADYILDESVGEFEVSYTGKSLSFKSENRFFSYEKFDRIDFLPVTGGQFKWNGIPYTGVLSFIREGQNLLLINQLPLPEYLRGVVPHEIPSHSEEYFQAVVGQTIAARTYAWYCIHHPVSKHFDLYADTRDQVYAGRKVLAPLADRAIKESRGLILQTQDGKSTKIQYHSTCGGMIELRSGDNNPMKVSPPVIADLADSSDYCLISPLYRWVRKLTARDILANLQQMGMISPQQTQVWIEEGFQITMEILSRMASGRVDRLEIKINNQNFVLSNWHIRRVFADKSGNSQPSNLFILKTSRAEPSTFYTIGGGYGHGRGMCQWGAIGQALDGKSYPDILKFYYPDLVIKKSY